MILLLVFAVCFCSCIVGAICGIGGVCTGADAAEMILAGATAVSVGTANMTDPTCVPRILAELEAWVQEQGVSDINELIGAFEC